MKHITEAFLQVTMTERDLKNSVPQPDCTEWKMQSGVCSGFAAATVFQSGHGRLHCVMGLRQLAE